MVQQPLETIGSPVIHAGFGSFHRQKGSLHDATANMGVLNEDCVF